MYEPGTVVLGKYRLGKTIGRGGMGVVVAAEHVELRSAVALKFLGEKYLRRADVVERFIREARACAQLRSEHICRVSDVGRLDSGVPYFVMELLSGFDLAKQLRAEGPQEVATIADYMVQACDAIIEAHAAQIVHRDLKPGNLFVTQRRDGSPMIKVLDFGVAKAQADDDFSLTGADAVIGSPNYMAPEQIRAARNADTRSDVWSLGVIMHEMLTGKPPFHGETIADLAVRITLDPLPPLVGVPRAFAAIVERCLEKDPAHRFQAVDELVAVLAPFLPESSTATRLSASRMAPGAAGAAPATTPFARSPASVSQQVTAVHALVPVTLEEIPPPPASTTLRSASGVQQLDSAAQPPAAPARGARRWVTIAAAAAIAIGVGAGILFGTGGHGDTGARGADEPARAATMPAAAPTPTPTPMPAAVTPPPMPMPAAVTPPIVVTPPSPPPAPLPPAPAVMPSSDAGAPAVTPAPAPASVDAAIAEPAIAAEPPWPPIVKHKVSPPPAPRPAKAKAKSKEQVGESRI